MQELAEIHDLIGRAGYYAALRFSTDTADPPDGALLQRVQESETAIETTLLFFELEWAALPDERAEELLAGEGLDFCRHHLRNVRRYRDHLLTEPEEKILAEKALTGASAWTRLFEELTSAIEVELPSSAPDGAGEGERVRARRRAQPPRRCPTARSGARPPRRSPPRSLPGCARARSCSTRCSPTRRPTTACAATRTGWPRATSPTRPATSRCRR